MGGPRADARYASAGHPRLHARGPTSTTSKWNDERLAAGQKPTVHARGAGISVTTFSGPYYVRARNPTDGCGIRAGFCQESNLRRKPETGLCCGERLAASHRRESKRPRCMLQILVAFLMAERVYRETTIVLRRMTKLKSKGNWLTPRPPTPTATIRRWLFFICPLLHLMSLQPPIGDSMQALPSSGVSQTDSQSEVKGCGGCVSLHC
jgi:hypothetical protein